VRSTGREGDYRNNVAQGAQIDYEDVPQAAVDLFVRVAHALNINQAGFDFVVIGDRCHLLEFNTLLGSDGPRRRNISVVKHIWGFLQKHTLQPTLTYNFRLSA
jgi:ribosomal protein S6--L-glutamate ligase